MKILFVAVISLFSFYSYANQQMNMTCTTEYPSTSFFVREVDKTVIVEIFHHNGTGYMPIFDGLATPNDMSTLTAKAKLLQELPTSLRFEWPREMCDIQGDMIFSCIGATDVQNHNGHKVSGWSFYSSHLTEKNFAGTYTYYKLSLSITVDGGNYEMPMKYGEQECSPEVFSAKKVRK